MCHGREHKREQEKIKRIQRPAKKTRNEGIALVAIENFEKPDRRHLAYIDGLAGRSFKAAIAWELPRNLMRLLRVA